MFRQVTIERLAFISLVSLLFVVALRMPVDTDTWWHLRSAEFMVTEGFIYKDVFSHTHFDEVWVNHSWGGQLILYGFYAVLGDGGLIVFQALLSVGGIMLLYRVCWGTVYERAFVLLLGASVASVFWSARPQMFSFFLNALLMAMLYDAKMGRSPIRWWVIPLLMWVWSHLHGGWFIGYLFLGGVLAGEVMNHITGAGGVLRLSVGQIRSLGLGVAISLPLLVLSPYGLENVFVPFQTVGMDALREFIDEWQSPSFQDGRTWTFLGMLLLFTLILWGSHRVFDWTSWFLVAGTLILALLYARNIAVFAIAATPVLAYHLHDWLERLGWQITPRRSVTRLQSRLNVVLAGMIIVSVSLYGAGVFVPSAIEDARRLSLPIDAVAHLNEAAYEGVLFNDYNWGGYLIEHARDYPVFIDGRTDLYDDFLNVYLLTSLGVGDWRGVLAEHNIGIALLEVGTGLDYALRQEAGWRVVYEDELAVIHQRHEGLHQEDTQEDGGTP